jgi:hypothetical protein
MMRRKRNQSLPALIPLVKFEFILSTFGIAMHTSYFQLPFIILGTRY